MEAVALAADGLDSLVVRPRACAQFLDVDIYGPLSHHRCEGPLQQIGSAEQTPRFGRQDGEEPELGWCEDDFATSCPNAESIGQEAEVWFRGRRSPRLRLVLGIITLVPEEKEEAQGSPLPAAAVTARDVVEAAKNGYEYRQSDKDKTWTLIKKQPQTVMKVHPEAVNSPEMLKVVQVFHLKPGLTKYELEVDKLDPYPVNFPPEGVTVLDLETLAASGAIFHLKGSRCPARTPQAAVESE